MRALDYFIHPTLSSNSDTHYQARVLVGILYTYLAILCFCNAYFVLLAPLLEQSAIASLGINIGLQITWLLSLYRLKNRGDYTLCAQISVASTFIAIFIGIILSGGPVTSPFIALGIIPIIMAFVLVSRKQGLAWAQISLLVHAVLLGAGASGFAYPQLLDMQYLNIHHGISWLIAYGAISGLMSVFKTLNQHLSKERDAKHQHLEYLATHDPLTQLANRSHFDASLKAALTRAKENTQQMGLLFIDLDDFKPINDTYGHKMGDQVLELCAKRMRATVRKTDLIARVGGDEFAIIIEQAQADEIQKIADKIKAALNLPLPEFPNPVCINASIGIASYPEQGCTSQALIIAADKAMYRCKQQKNENMRQLLFCT